MKQGLTGLLLLTLTACGGSGDNPEPLPPLQGERILEIDITPAESRDYATAFAEAGRLGMQATSLSLDWTLIETGLDTSVDPPQPVYQNDPDLDFLAIADFCYPKTATRISLTLRPVVTLVRNTPPDLADRPLDDPAVIARFEQLVDHVFAKLPNLELTSLVIGSEIDLYLKTDALRAQWSGFYAAVSAHARDRYRALYPDRPALKIATEVTWQGLVDPSTRGYYQALNRNSDVIGISYYPMDEQGQVRDPSVFGSDVDALLALYPDKPLYFYQLGYPSGYSPARLYPELLSGAQPSIGSSADRQAAFVAEVFRVWDREVERIGLIDFTWLHDLSPQAVIETTRNPAFGGSADPAPEFLEFLRTLGLGGWSSSDGVLEKPAWSALREAAAVRGWPQRSLAFCQ